ncbi:hypothetical protein GCM10010252_52310 [Streptomyces aureoverticillatus]|nr:hypothetical protein GCM10010252_52310 [Streptomyces aureoverticillatus]
MGLHADGAEEDEDGEQGQGGDEGGQAERVGHGLEFLDVHQASPNSAMRKAISRNWGNGRVRANGPSMGRAGWVVQGLFKGE